MTQHPKGEDALAAPPAEPAIWNPMDSMAPPVAQGQAGPSEKCPVCNGAGVIGTPGRPCEFCAMHKVGVEYRKLVAREEGTPRPVEPAQASPPSAPLQAPEVAPYAWEWFDQAGEHHLSLTEPADYELPLQLRPLFDKPAAPETALKAAPVASLTGDARIDRMESLWRKSMRSSADNMPMPFVRELLAAPVSAPPGWIPVSERLPNEQGEYLVHDDTGRDWLAYYSPNLDAWSVHDGVTVTHWRNKPEPPAKAAPEAREP